MVQTRAVVVTPASVHLWHCTLGLVGTLQVLLNLKLRSRRGQNLAPLNLTSCIANGAGQLPINRLTQYFALYWSLVILGYLATSGAKSDVIFLLGDPDFP